MTDTNPTVLLVIDLQKGVLPGCFDADGVVERTATLVDRARFAGTPVVWVQHEEEDLPWESAPWQLADGLVPAAGEPRLRKEYRDAFA
ncbi:MAG: isochorismatase family protein, partial [Actinobacteria bacterium]|nr:isochorismatase family protein [Actinomycetota bacterium]